MIEPGRVLSIAKTLAATKGTYIEAGANDGLRQSNTLELERELGWSGLLVEPSPVAFAQLHRNRPSNTLVNAALVSRDAAGGAVKGAFRDGQLTGTLDPSLFSRSADTPLTRWDSVTLRLRRAVRLSPKVSLVEVRTTTLDAAITEAGISRIDLLSLDVEGFELQALQGLDFARHRPRVIVLEVRRPDAWALLELLTIAGYAVMENLSKFALEQSPTWTGDHDDFLLVDQDELSANDALRQVLLDRTPTPDRPADAPW